VTHTRVVINNSSWQVRRDFLYYTRVSYASWSVLHTQRCKQNPLCVLSRCSVAKHSCSNCHHMSSWRCCALWSHCSLSPYVLKNFASTSARGPCYFPAHMSRCTGTCCVLPCYFGDRTRGRVVNTHTSYSGDPGSQISVRRLAILSFSWFSSVP
jgi:hypothetical protein